MTEVRAISQASVPSLGMPALSVPQRWTGEEAKHRQRLCFVKSGGTNAGRRTGDVWGGGIENCHKKLAS